MHKKIKTKAKVGNVTLPKSPPPYDEATPTEDNIAKIRDEVRGELPMLD